MNNPRNPEDESVSREIERLDTEMQEMKKQQEMCLQRKKQLMAAEDPAKGVFFSEEIHTMQMDYLRLEVEAETRRRKINRLRLGYEC
ncbi:hypothetical protein [Desulfonatronospira sp.]|uniref:hypothetical protein n=1 Tax=Desulfonatronospira sp. TaxID=1962951 RepID=UPI0025B87A33|nr:hypothetical protein [Desulfonatronospira sp.]